MRAYLYIHVQLFQCFNLFCIICSSPFVCPVCSFVQTQTQFLFLTQNIFFVKTPPKPPTQHIYFINKTWTFILFVNISLCIVAKQMDFYNVFFILYGLFYDFFILSERWGFSQKNLKTAFFEKI